MSYNSYDRNSSTYQHELLVKYEYLIRGNERLFFDEEAFICIITQYLQQERYPYALTATEYALSHYPSAHELYFLQAKILYLTEVYDNALPIIEKSIILSSGVINYYLLYAKIFEALGEVTEAYKVLEERLEHTFNNTVKSQLYLGLANIAIREMDFDAAFNYLQETIVNDCKVEEAFEKFSFCAEVLEKEAEAVDIFQHILQDYPDSAVAWYSLGMLQLSLCHYKGAVESFDYARSLDIHFTKAYYVGALTLFQNEDYESALEWCLEGIENRIGSSCESLHLLTGKCYHYLHNFTKARIQYQIVLERNPSEANAYYLIGQTFVEEGDIEQGVQAIQKASDLLPNSADYLETLAKLYMMLGATEMAQTYYCRAIDIAPDDNDLRLRYNTFLFEIEEIE